MIETLLPDKWGAVVEMRTRKLYYSGLRNLRTRKLMFESCEECPMLKTIIVEGDYDIWFLTACRILGNKCIKQYPHRIDNEEFK